MYRRIAGTMTALSLTIPDVTVVVEAERVCRRHHPFRRRGACPIAEGHRLEASGPCYRCAQGVSLLGVLPPGSPFTPSGSRPTMNLAAFSTPNGVIVSQYLAGGAMMKPDPRLADAARGCLLRRPRFARRSRSNGSPNCRGSQSPRPLGPVPCPWNCGCSCLSGVRVLGLEVVRFSRTDGLSAASVAKSGKPRRRRAGESFPPPPQPRALAQSATARRELCCAPGLIGAGPSPGRADRRTDTMIYRHEA